MAAIPAAAAARFGFGDPRRWVGEPGVGDRKHDQPRVRDGRWWLTDLGVLRYSLAVRAPSRAVRVPREPFGGRTAPSTYDLTK